MAREISNEVQKVLSEMFKDGKFDFSINGGRFSDDKLKINLEVHIKNADGSLVISESSHDEADKCASMRGLTFEGHILGSSWNVHDVLYVVEDYLPKSKKYKFALKRADGRRVKSTVGFLAQGVQLLIPTESDFVKWFTIDPDSDAVRESDVEICDRVQGYLDSHYPVEDGDMFYELVDKFNEKGAAERWAKRAYELLFREGASMSTAYKGMKLIYNEL